MIGPKVRSEPVFTYAGMSCCLLMNLDGQPATLGSSLEPTLGTFENMDSSCRRLGRHLA